jgi:predicted Zn-dependent protease
MRLADRIVTLLFVGAALMMLSLPSSGHQPSGTTELDEEAIGSVQFDTSCAERTRQSFNRGIALLHSFWFDASIAAFEAVLKTDSNCAMAEWGIAMSHWGNPLGKKRPKPSLRPGSEAVARARSLGTDDERESLYIEAVAELYRDFETTPDHPRAVAFEKAMAKIVERYPNDTEAAIFYAMALNGTADLKDKTYAQQIRAAEILERAFEEQPNHPGIAHYIIHSYDAPALAARALPAARQYAGIAPAAPHALHMPSHTFTRLGHWQDSIDTNLLSAEAAKKANSPAEVLHAYDYMVYGYLQTAQDDAARGVLDKTGAVFEEVPLDDRYVVAGAYAAAAVPARYALERGDWARASSIEPVASPAPFVNAIVYFARGLGAARNGDLADARAAHQNLVKLANTPGQSAYWAEQVEIQREVVEAWIELAEGKPDQALASMTASAEREDATEKSGISPGPLAPARELLGEMLLELGKPTEALTAFRATIEKEPGRFRGLFGGAIAAEAAGHPQLAKQYFARLLENCERSAPGRPELAKAKAFVAAN